MVDDISENGASSRLAPYALETLRVDNEFVVSRGKRLGEPANILTVTTSGRSPSAATLAQLKHPYTLRHELDGTWATRPIALVQELGCLTLFLEDPGGELLDSLLGEPLSIAEFLRLAIGLAATVRRLHQQGLIHKDIKPANLLVQPSTGQVWLTGFGLCSRVPRERQALKPAEVIAGTLAYMAPEQTGRMNRSVDSRADLYSCGVTLYQMLTGQLPFSASDAMEWLHCHIARQPLSPSQRIEGIRP